MKDDLGTSGLSRRDLLKGFGAGATAAALAGTARAAPPDEDGVIGADEVVKVACEVDGKAVEAGCTPSRTLLEFLREDLGITAPKSVCDRGACGACTVMVDGVPVNSCMRLAIESNGVRITTAAGLGAPGALHPVQAAFWEHDAHQCGFCTPGMVVSMASALAANPQATAAELRAAASGNLCRCGTYTRVLDAALAIVRAKGAK